MLAESGDVEADDIHGLLAEETLEGTGEFGAQGPGAGAGGMCSCLSIAYYRPFFDVDTDEVLGRVRAALLFCHSEPFLRVLRNKPDAYGPWWIATTLIFLISVTSHFKALLSLGDDYEYDFAAVTFSAMAVYTYLGLAAFTSWLCLNYWLKVPMALLNCLCIVGYSLVPYLPASLACVLPYMAWPAVLAAAGAQTAFSLKAALPAIEQHPKEKAAVYAGAVVVLNVGLMLIIKLYLY
ncbi:tRNA-specific adenosine deaminase [Aureococcus anophagefferens]|uniref:Protein YIPF n=2 Tax=Aureococcus anophagefferens TaxID=44056 RepID=A0ABR1FXE2_AURAN|nr:Rab GTPase binding protein [Aureococcus anophagefferens]